jgi:hypothetical protein
LAVQLLDPAPREFGKKGVFVACCERFELGRIIGVLVPVPGLKSFSDILRRWADLRDSNETLQQADK